MKIIIPCGSKKTKNQSKPKDLYVGSYHKACARWATSVAPDNDIFILSAKHGFLPYESEQLIEPYNLSFKDKNYVNQSILNQQAHSLNIKTAIVLGGKDYALRARLAIRYIKTLNDFARLDNFGLGRQMQFLNNNNGVKFWHES